MGYEIINFTKFLEGYRAPRARVLDKKRAQRRENNRVIVNSKKG